MKRVSICVNKCATWELFPSLLSSFLFIIIKQRGIPWMEILFLYFYHIFKVHYLVNYLHCQWFGQEHPDQSLSSHFIPDANPPMLGTKPFKNRKSPEQTQASSWWRNRGQTRRVNKLYLNSYLGLGSNTHSKLIRILIDPLVTPVAALDQEINFFTSRFPLKCLSEN